MKPRALIFGTFDLLHLGHLKFLKECATSWEVIVGLSTDTNATRKRKPILTYHEREATLYELPWVAKVVPKDTPSAKPLITQERPLFLAYGSDWEKSAWLNENEINLVYLDEMAINLVVLVNDNILSATDIIDRVKKSLP